MKKLLTFILFIFFIFSVWGSSIEVLKTDLVTALPKERVGILKSLSDRLIYDDPNAAVYYSNIGLDEVEYGGEDYTFFLFNKGLSLEFLDQTVEAINCYKDLLKIALNNNDYELIARAQLSIGAVLSIREDYDTALTYLYLAVEKFNELDISGLEATTNNEIGMCYEMQSLHARALEYYFKSYEINLKLKDDFGLGNTTVNIGNVYNSLKNNEKSMEYYDLAKVYYTKVEDVNGLATVYNNIGNVYDEHNDVEKALEYYRKSLELTDPNTDKGGYSVTLNNIASIQLHLEDLDDGYKSAKQALKLAKELDNKQYIVSSSLVLHEYFEIVEISDSSLVYLQNAYNLAKQENQKDMLQDCYGSLSDYYKSNGEFKLALDYSEKFIALHDTIYGKASEEIAIIQSSYENIEKKIEIEALTKEKEMQDKLRYYLIFLIIVLFALVLLFFTLFKQKQREVAIKEEMQRQKEQETSLRSIIYNISQIADKTNNLDEVYNAIQENFKKVIDTTNFFIAFYNEARDYFNCPLSKDSKDKYNDYPAGKTLSSYIINTKEAFLGTNEDIDLLEKKGKIIRQGSDSKCWLGVPLLVGGNTLGVMVVQDYDDVNAFNSKDLEMMKFFGSQISNILMRISTDKDLSESEERFRILAQNSNAAIFTIDKNGEFKFVNPTVERITGYSAKELQSMKALSIIHPDHKHLLKERLVDRLKNQTYEDSQYKFITKNEDIHWMELSSSLINLKDETYILCSALDITESKRHETNIMASLKEKEILLKEVHHRVKNNMQIITSLLKLQSQYIEDEEIKQLFTVSQNRVRSMSLVHEKLYASPDLANIVFGSYLRNISTHLMVSYVNDLSKINIEYDLDETNLDINKAIPCGLIINELLTNCFKYAFPNERDGYIKITFNLKDDIYNLIISDNGIGMSEDFIIDEADTLGLQLVSSLVIQLHGTLEVDGSNGSSFKIKFPKESNKKLT